MIYRGTTPTIRLHINNTTFNVSDLTERCITIVNDSGRNKKIFNDCVADDTTQTISVTLSHDDTLGFEPGYLLVQLTANLGNEEMASPILRTEIGDNLKERV